MSQFTTDPDGIEIELLDLPEWGSKNNRKLDNVKDLSDYKNYATTNFLRSGQKPDQFSQSLNETLFNEGRERGIFQAPDAALPEPEQLTKLNEQFSSFANSDRVDSTKDLDLVVNSLPEEDPLKTKGQEYLDRFNAQRTSGLKDTTLDILGSEVKDIFSADRIQDARIQYAKDKNLSFMDFPTVNEAGQVDPQRRGVWINPSVNPDRKMLFEAVNQSQGLIDPYAVTAAESMIQTDQGKTMPRYKQQELEINKQLFGETEAKSAQVDRSQQGSNFSMLMDQVVEVANDGYAQTKDINKATEVELTKKIDTGVPIISGMEGESYVYNQKEVGTGKSVDLSLKLARRALAQSDPTNPLIKGLSEDEFVQVGKDYIKQRLAPPLDVDKPENNFATLSDGSKIPLGTTALLSTEKFEQGMDKLGLEGKDRDIASAVRKGYLAANTSKLDKVLSDFGGDEYHDYMVNTTASDPTKTKTDLIADYIDQKAKEDSWATWLKPRAAGLARSWSDGGSAVIQAVGGGITTLIGWEGGRKALEDWAISDAKRKQDRGTFALAMGSPLGIGYEFAEQAAPMIIDIALTKGAGSLARTATKAVMKSTAGTAARFGTEAIKGVLGEESKTLLGKLSQKALTPYVEGLKAGTSETSPAQLWRVMRKDIEDRLAPLAAATATQRGLSGARSAQGSYVETVMDMRSQKNADGSNKFSEKQIQDAALVNGLNSGVITALVEHSFGKYFGEGADQLMTGKNLRQIKFYANQLSQSVRGSGIGGDELYGILKNVVKDVVQTGSKEMWKEMPSEFGEEFVDTLTSTAVNALVNNKDLDVVGTIKDSFKAGFMGAGYGGLIGGTVKSGVLSKIDQQRDMMSGTAQGIQKEILEKTIAKLEENGSSPETVAILKDRMRIAQRRYQAVADLLPTAPPAPAAADALDQLEEEPFDIPKAPAPTVPPEGPHAPTRLALKQARDLAVSIDELKTIQGSGKINKDGIPTITPNDVLAYVNNRTAENFQFAFQGGDAIFNPPGGVQSVGENRPPENTPEERTFNDMKDTVVVIDGQRGKIRVENGEVLLDPETGDAPIILPANADMKLREFEGFEGTFEEKPMVSTRRAPRQIDSVSEQGKVVYGNTEYDLPNDPRFANVRKASDGSIESMHILVENSKCLKTWVYAAGENIPSIETVYRVRGNESSQGFNEAVANAQEEEILRNKAAQENKPVQSKKRRQQKREERGAPLVTDLGQATMEVSADYRVNQLNDPTTSAELINALNVVATQLGIDSSLISDPRELFTMIGPDLAAGLDIDGFSPAQINSAVFNLRNNGEPTTILEHLVNEEMITPADRIRRNAQIQAFRNKNKGQAAKHGIKAGMDVNTVLQSIAKSATNKLHRETAKQLLKLGVTDVPVIVASLPNNNSVAGAYLRSSNAVILNLASDNGGGPVDVMLHELMHSVSERIISNPQNAVEVEVRSRLLALRAEYMAKAEAKFEGNVPLDLRYALEGRFSLDERLNEQAGAAEMVSHFFASQQFRERLNQLSPKGERNFVQRIIDAIASVFSGKRIPDAAISDLVKVMTDLTQATSNLGPHPYGRTSGQGQASRVAIAQAKGLGPLNGVPNPYTRDSFQWAEHQIGTLSNVTIPEQEIRTIIEEGKFGMLTAENPNNTILDDDANALLNIEGKQWLLDHGYDVHEIVGRYDAKGENSFLIPGLKFQDAVDFAVKFNQESVALDSGMVYQDGSYNPRIGGSTDQEVEADDNYFSAIRGSNGTVVPIRVVYDWENKVEPEFELNKVRDIAGKSAAFNQVLKQDDFEVEESTDTLKPFVVRDGKMIVNEKLLNEKLDDLSPEDSDSVLEQAFVLAAAHDKAIRDIGPEFHIEFENSGINTEAILESIADGSLTTSDLNDLKLVDQGKLQSFLASAYAEIATRNNGSNERLATAQNQIGDMIRASKDGYADIPETAESFVGSPSQVALDIIAGSALPEPLVNYSKTAAAIVPSTVKQNVKAGTTVGTRNPVAKRATESGTDSNARIDLATMRLNQPVYRKNALLLVEYPLVAREFPKLAAEVRRLRAKIAKTAAPVTANAGQINSYKATAKNIIARELGVKAAKVSNVELENTLTGTTGKVKLTGANAVEFTKLQKDLKKAQDKGTLLKATAKEARDTFSKTLDHMSKDEAHPIALQADKVYEAMIKATESNLEALINLFPAEIREIAKLWYDGANIISNDFSGQYKKTVEQASGVLAVFSPQKDWFMNISLADRTMNIWDSQQNFAFDEKMAAQWMKRGGEPQVTGEEKDGTPIYEKGKASPLVKDGEVQYDEDGNMMFTGWSSTNAEINRANAKRTLDRLSGKKLSELSIEDQSKFIRMYSETYDSPSFRMVTPDGKAKDFSRTEKGAEQKIAWPGYGTVQKAIRILSADAGSQIQVISEELGKQHKVRSFYNNIVDPASTAGHVTMDTHAVAALFWQAFSGNSFEVGQNFGTAGTSSDGTLGVNGMYAPNAEAYRAAAAAFGILPREAQSITWEAVRLLFPAKWKSQKANVDRVRAVWAKYESDKTFTLDQARSEIFKITTAKYDRDGNVTQEGKDLTEAFKDTNSLLKGLGFPSWAEVTKGPAPAGEISTVRLSKPPVPREFADKQVTLTHWSYSPEMTETDPSRHGSGGGGNELKRRKEYPKIYSNRTYFGYGNYGREQQIGQNRYAINIDGNLIYDFKRDELDLYPSSEDLMAKGYARFDQRAAITLYENAIKEAGFAGYVNTDFHAGVLFGKHSVTKVENSNKTLPLTESEGTPLFSRSWAAVTAASPESAYMLSLDDVMMNEVTGKFEAGNKFTQLFRASGGMDPRLFEANQYQARAISLANKRLTDLMGDFKKAVKDEKISDFADVNLALGSTEPTVKAQDRDKAGAIRDAEIAKAHKDFQSSDHNKNYRAQVDAARADLLIHKNKQIYLDAVKDAQDERAGRIVPGPNQPMNALQIRDAQIEAAKAQYDQALQSSRANNLKPVRQAMVQAQLRLEQQSPKTAEIVRTLRTSIDELSTQLLGELEPDNPMRMTIDGNLGVYLTRSYKIHHDEGYAQKFLKEPEFVKERTDARKYLENDWVKSTAESWRKDVAYEPFSDSEILALARQEAKSKSMGEVLLNQFVSRHGATPASMGADQKRYDLTRFMEKGEVPEELKAVMGEIVNPIEVAARTYGNLAQFIGTQRLLKSYTQIGIQNDWLVTAKDIRDNPLKYDGYEQLVQTTKSRGGDPLSNYYAAPEVKEAFTTMFQTTSKPASNAAMKVVKGIDRAASTAVGVTMAAMTLGSGGFYVRNLASIPFFIAGNGFIPSPSNIADALKGISEINYGKIDELGSKLIALGVVDGSMNMNLIKDLIRGMAADPELNVQKLNQLMSSPTKAATLFTKSGKAVSSIFGSLTNLNDSIDSLYRIAYWSHELDVQQKANAVRTVPLNQTQMEQEAARTVRRTSQGHSNVAPLAKELGKSGFGTIFNSFFRFTAEMIRLPVEITMVGIEEKNSGNAVLRARGIKRLVGLGSTLVFSAALPEIIKAIYHVGDDEEEAIRASLPDYEKNKDLFFTKGPKGVTKYNWSYVNPWSIIVDPFARSLKHIFNGRKGEVAGVLTQALGESFLSPQIAVNAFREVAGNEDNRGAPIWLDSDSTGSKIGRGLLHLWKGAYKLKTPAAFYNAFEAYTNKGNYNEQSRTTKAIDIIAGEFKPFQPRTMANEKIAQDLMWKLKDEQDKATKTLSRLNTKDALDEDEVRKTYTRYENAATSIAQRMYSYGKGMEKLGLTQGDYRRAATGASGVGFSKNKFDKAVKYGVLDRYAPAPEAMADYFKAGGPDNGAARVASLRKIIAERPRLIPLTR